LDIMLYELHRDRHFAKRFAAENGLSEDDVIAEPPVSSSRDRSVATLPTK